MRSRGTTADLRRRRPFISLIGLVFAVLITVAAVRTADAGPLFVAELDGLQEVPPVVTGASGFATFQFDGALTELTFELSVFDIDDVTAAHIHLGPPGVNGPVVAFLFGPDPGTGLVNGLLASGTITGADLTGPLAGEPLTTLLDVMVLGNTYANVHTLAFPGGEIRGQILVPQPGTLALLGVGLAAICWIRRRAA